MSTSPTSPTSPNSRFNFTHFWRTSLKSSPKTTTKGEPSPLVEMDDDELDRLQLHHFLARLCFNKNYTAPVDDVLKAGGKVLEVGCGPAAWSLEMASAFPNSQFFGFDVSEVFPQSTMPSNCFFELGDVKKLPLRYKDNEFDLVSMRYFAQILNEENWAKVLRELLRITKKGGYIQLFEADYELESMGPNTIELMKGFFKAMRKRGVSPVIAKKLPSILTNAGLVNVREDACNCPVGNFEQSELGVMVKEGWAHSVKAYKPFLIKAKVMDEKDVDYYVSKVFDEMEEYRTREYFRACYGQKPL